MHRVDLERPPRDFPDLTFAIHHLALPYFDECVYLAARNPNVVLVLSGTMHLPFVAPWDFKQYLGRLLRDVGSDRLLWGSEAPITGNPRPAIEWFWNMQIDDELQERHGYLRLQALRQTWHRTSAAPWGRASRPCEARRLAASRQRPEHLQAEEAG
jgi:predicted TIM-barrel fold metal-dependent hydrolase